MATVDNPRLGKILLRRGFWDADIQRGFGMDKAWHKHALTSRAAQKVLLGSTNNKKQSNGNFDLRTYVGKYDCKDQWNCTLREQMLVHAFFDPTTLPAIMAGRSMANWVWRPPIVTTMASRSVRDG
jgi:hypothetical protein